MGKKLAFAVVTPYTIRKSRTGAVLGRLLGRASTELIATQMLAPTAELVERLVSGIGPGSDAEDDRYRSLVRDYVRREFPPDLRGDRGTGRRHRVLLLVFKDDNAYAEITQIVGKSISHVTGMTIRDTYGDLVLDDDGAVRYFEPAVLYPSSEDTVVDELNVWLDFAENEPGVLERMYDYSTVDDPSPNVERTLVLIKPDNWREGKGSVRAGSIIDMFSRTGLRIVGCKLCRMSVCQAERFYGSVRSVLAENMGPRLAAQAAQVLISRFGLSAADASRPDFEAVTRSFGDLCAELQYQKIVEFMTGCKVADCAPENRTAPGGKRCLALVYEGPDAVRKIRQVLGPTDLQKAPPGTVRFEFGLDVMVNSAHASDSVASALREMDILELRQGDFTETVRRHLKGLDG